MLLLSLPKPTLHAITGNMLGDGAIQYPNFSRDKKITGNARYAMTMSITAQSYMEDLYNTVYKPYTSRITVLP